MHTKTHKFKGEEKRRKIPERQKYGARKRKAHGKTDEKREKNDTLTLHGT